MKKWLFALLMLTLSAHAEIMMRVRPHIVAVPQAAVLLDQLVDAQGVSAETARQLHETSVTVAPEMGERQELANAHLTTLLRPIVQAERERSQSTVHLVIPKSVVIDTIKRGIGSDEVRAELLQAWQPLCADCRLEIEGLSLPNVNDVRDWTLKIPADLPRGSFSVSVDIVRQSGAPLTAWVSGRLLTKKKVPVANRMFSPADRLQAKDFSWEYRDTSFAFDGIPQAEEILGHRMKQGVRSGDIIWRSLIEREKAIQRGEMVTVRAAEGTWEVSMTLVAQQDAFLGDVINLKHPKTNAQLVGHVTGQGEVELR